LSLSSPQIPQGLSLYLRHDVKASGRVHAKIAVGRRA